MTHYTNTVLAHLFYIGCWARDGLTENEIAARLGVPPKSLQRMKKKNKSLREALAQTREKSNLMVEDALFRRAVGCKTIEETVTADENGAVKSVKTVQKEVLPDIKAAEDWLRMKYPERWGVAPEEGRLEALIKGLEEPHDL